MHKRNLKQKTPRMPAVLLAAGLGTRLAPITHKIPKCLVPIHGKPLLSYWLELCCGNGMFPVIVNTQYLENEVISFIKNSSWSDYVELLHEENLLGTGGTLLNLKESLRDGPFFVAHADNLSFFSMQKFIESHQQRPENCMLTMMTFRTPTPQSCGIVDVDDAGIVKGFYEKVPNPPGDLANGAVFIMEPEVLGILDTIKKPVSDISTDILPKCLGRMATFFNDNYHRDIGTLESYGLAQVEMYTRFLNRTSHE